MFDLKNVRYIYISVCVYLRRASYITIVCIRTLIFLKKHESKIILGTKRRIYKN